MSEITTLFDAFGGALWASSIITGLWFVLDRVTGRRIETIDYPTLFVGVSMGFLVARLL